MRLFAGPPFFPLPATVPNLEAHHTRTSRPRLGLPACRHSGSAAVVATPPCTNKCADAHPYGSRPRIDAAPPSPLSLSISRCQPATHPDPSTARHPATARSAPRRLRFACLHALSRLPSPCPHRRPCCRVALYLPTPSSSVLQPTARFLPRCAVRVPLSPRVPADTASPFLPAPAVHSSLAH